MDQYNIKVDNTATEPTTSKSNITTTLTEINMLVPEGLRNPLAFDTSIQGRLCVGPTYDKCRHVYRANVVSMITKLPGFFYTGYATAQFYNQPVVTQKSYKLILDELMKSDTKG